MLTGGVVKYLLLNNVDLYITSSTHVSRTYYTVKDLKVDFCVEEIILLSLYILVLNYCSWKLLYDPVDLIYFT